MTGPNDGLKILGIVVVFAVTQFNRPYFSRFSVKSEIIVEAPPIVTKTFFDRETGGDLVVVARHIGNPNPRKEVRFPIGIVGFRERPSELEPSLNDDPWFVTFIFFIEFHLRVEIGHRNVV